MKIVWDGEWVSAMPLVNKQFPVDDPACEICGRVSCAPAWISIKTRRVRCRKCFTPGEYGGKGVQTRRTTGPKGINSRRTRKPGRRPRG
jgi:hypothetical protein